jgi:hypothetical protein
MADTALPRLLVMSHRPTQIVARLGRTLVLAGALFASLLALLAAPSATGAAELVMF